MLSRAISNLRQKRLSELGLLWQQKSWVEKFHQKEEKAYAQQASETAMLEDNF